MNKIFTWLMGMFIGIFIGIVSVFIYIVKIPGTVEYLSDWVNAVDKYLEK